MKLETAKQLKELGWDKETENVYRPHPVLKEMQLRNRHVIHNETLTEFYPCPSLEDLLAVMPKLVHGTAFKLIRYEDFWCAYYGGTTLFAQHPDPTEAVAMLWIKLKKEGIV